MSGTKTAPEAFLEIRGLKKYFGVHGGLLHAVDDVSIFLLVFMFNKVFNI